MMEEFEIKQLEQTVTGSMLYNAKNPLWEKAFGIYNNAPEQSGQSPLSLHCRPCYSKVLLFLRKKYLGPLKIKKVFIDGTISSLTLEQLQDWDNVLHDFKPWFTRKHFKMYRTKSHWVVTSHIRGWDVTPIATRLDGFWKALSELLFPKILK